MENRKYLHWQTPAVEVGGDVLINQRMQQIFGKTPEQTAGLGRWRTDTFVLQEDKEHNNISLKKYKVGS